MAKEKTSSLLMQESDAVSALKVDNFRLIALLESHVIEWRLPPKPAAVDTIEAEPSNYTPQEKLHLSRNVFARYLRTNERTLENWKQGRASPNAQAAVLIRMVEQSPDIVERLSTI
ncbi:MAG: hypothetical protein WC742_13785 [Gallionellaceae bacterium]